MEKQEKKGFWASLFTSKPCKCSCGKEYAITAGDAHVGSPSNGCGEHHTIKEIKVLGPGCSKCKSTYVIVEKTIKASGMNIRLTKIEDIEEIMRYNIMATPAIVVDEQVVMKGKVPTEAEVKRLLGI